MFARQLAGDKLLTGGRKNAMRVVVSPPLTTFDDSKINSPEYS